jgi:hypothetical protein
MKRISSTLMEQSSSSTQPISPFEVQYPNPTIPTESQKSKTVEPIPEVIESPVEPKRSPFETQNPFKSQNTKVPGFLNYSNNYFQRFEVAPKPANHSQETVNQQQPGTEPHAISQTVWGTKPQEIVCPHCNKEIKTRVSTKANEKAWGMAADFVTVTVCLPCLWIPFARHRDTKHKCPTCKKELGRSKGL